MAYLFGALAGLCMGLLGGGGSILTIPVLVYLMGIEPKTSIAMSLAIVGITAVPGVISHYRQKNVLLKTAFIYLPSSIMGTFLGTYLAGFMSGKTQLIIFAGVLLIVSFMMFFKKGRTSDKGTIKLPLIIILGSLSGVIIGIVGVGGGFMIVPILTLFAGVSMTNAIGTSLLIICINSLGGFIGYWGLVEIPWQQLISFSLFSSVGILIGSYFTRFIDQQKLKKGFAFFVLIMGVFILVQNKEAFAHSSKKISLSFDDAPMGTTYFSSIHERSRILVNQLERANAGQVIFYANPGKIKRKEQLDVLKFYQKKGHLIGNHTWSHLNLNKVSVEEYLSDFNKGHEYLKEHDLLSPYFRYPYLRRGNNLYDVRRIRSHIMNHNYVDAFVTIDNYDWYMNAQFKKAFKTKKINYEQLKKYYVETLMKSTRFYSKLASENLNGGSIKHVMLLHENDLAALFIKDFIFALRSEGWEIITPADSYTNNPLNEYPDVLKHGDGRVVSRLTEMKYKGKKKSGFENEGVLDKLFEEYQILNLTR